MADFYKLDIGDWNVGTDDLTLEQEAAYFRVVNAIRQAEQPIRYNFFVLGGLWRCNERKAKRILKELIDAGKLSVEGGSIINRRAVDEASALRRTKVERRSAGSRGGIESGKSRAKALETNETQKDLLQPEQSRAEQSRTKSNPSDSPDEKTRSDFEQFWGAYPHRNGAKIGEAAAQANFEAAVARGVTSEEMIDGAKNLQRDRKAIDGYAKDPAKWIEQEGWRDDIEISKPKSPPPPPDTPEAKLIRLQYLEKTAAAMQDAGRGQWTIGSRFVDARDLKEILEMGLAPEKLGQPA